MKKHKSVVSILLAVMMIFVMMPTMAFAANVEPTATWNGYDSVTFAGAEGIYDRYNGTYETEKSFVTTGTYAGAVAVQVKDPGIAGVDVSYLRSKAGTKYYYDLDNAVIARYSGGNYTALYDTYASYFDWNTPNALLFNAPEGTYTGTKPAPVGKQASSGKVTLGGNWEGTIATDPNPVTYTGEDQTVTVFVDVAWNQNSSTAGVEGVVPAKTVTIKSNSHGHIPSSLNNHLYKDEVNGDNRLSSADVSATYDGKEHTLIAEPVKGYSVSYTVFNSKTGKWDAVDAVTFKDKAAKVSARATYFDDAKASVAGYTGETPLAFSVTVNANSAKPTVAFTSDPKAPTEFVKGKYDPWDYVVVKNAVVKDDEAALLAYFKDAYTIEETSTSAFDSTEYKWSFKAVTPAPKAADYAILANYGTPTAPTGERPVTILESDPSADFEVEFTSAPSKKVYHVKKAKKTKKAYSFTVKAEASNGATVKYKLVDANSNIKIDKTTGKITIKKGLAKGTYKIKVKAYVPGMNAYGYAQETQAIKIVIKK